MYNQKVQEPDKYYIQSRPLGEILEEPTEKPVRDFVFTEYADITIIKLNLKRATLVESKKLRPYLDDLIDKGYGKIIVDLTECNLIDSTFWGMLIYAQKRIHYLDGSIRLVYNFEKHSTLTIVTGIYKIFKMYKDIPTALDSFTKRKLASTLVDFNSDFE